jgi:hypothetical protein
MANTVLAGYVTSISDKYEIIVDHTGPVSYTTGGETINASDFGIGGFETVAVHALSSPGLNGVAVIFSTTAAPTGAAVKTVKLKWFTSATMVTEASGNLSAQTVRLQIRGV